MHDNVVSELNLIRLSNLKHEDRQVLDQKIKNSMRSVRLLSHNMLPPELEHFDLTELIQNYLDEIPNEVNTNFFHSCFVNDTVPATTKLHLLRILQEVINNSLKHAKPTELRVSLRVSLGHLSLLVTDNGKGMSDNKKDGAGLKNIINRTQYLNGNSKFKSRIGKGTRFILIVPN